MSNQIGNSENPYSASRTPIQDQQGPIIAKQKHSRLGIASFVLAMLIGILAVGLVVTAGIVEASSPGGIDEQSAVAIIVGLGIFAIIGLSFVGCGLGIAGLFQPNRNRLFGILGLIFNTLIIFGLVGLIAIGLAIG